MGETLQQILSLLTELDTLNNGQGYHKLVLFADCTGWVDLPETGDTVFSDTLFGFNSLDECLRELMNHRLSKG